MRRYLAAVYNREGGTGMWYVVAFDDKRDKAIRESDS